MAFEFTREIALIGSAQAARPNVSKHIFTTRDYVFIRGAWNRSDGGSPILPGTVAIECRKDLGKCVEASVMSNNEYYFAPEIDWFDAQFRREGVSYINDDPDWARYTVRSDTTTEHAFATRDRKIDPNNDNCAKLEKHVAMELDEGRAPADPFGGRLVPLLTPLPALQN